MPMSVAVVRSCGCARGDCQVGALRFLYAQVIRPDLLCGFFFQAEDGIRDIGVTGVQTCALPISRELVVVFVPQYVVGHWWENLLHNQSALRLRARLQFQPGVMITSVPWQLESSLDRDDSQNGSGPAPGDLRRGLTDDAEQTPYG